MTVPEVATHLLALAVSIRGRVPRAGPQSQRIMRAEAAAYERAPMIQSAEAAPAPLPGDLVTVRGSFGADLPVEGVVIGKGEEAGRPVIDYRGPDGRERWAYLDQITDLRPTKQTGEAPR